MPEINETYTEGFMVGTIKHPEASDRLCAALMPLFEQAARLEHHKAMIHQQPFDAMKDDCFPIFCIKPPRFLSYYALKSDCPWMQGEKISGKYGQSYIRKGLYSTYLREYIAGPVKLLTSSDEVEINFCEIIDQKDFEPKYNCIRLMLKDKKSKKLSVKLGYDVPKFQKDDQNHRTEIGKKRRK